MLTRFGTPGVVVLDIKTGQIPFGKLQLATYAVALQVMYDVRATTGYFWQPQLGGDGSGRAWVPSDTGGITAPIRLGDWDIGTLARGYFAARRGIDSGIFIPNLTNLCSGCSVREYCWGYAGSKAKPVPHPPQKENV